MDRLDAEILNIVDDVLGGLNMEDRDKRNYDTLTLDDLGADSLDAVEILTNIEEKYNVKFTEESKTISLGELRKYVMGYAIKHG